jgi:outer membrane protein
MFLAFSICLLVAAPVAAQRELSLEEALRTARAQNPAYLRSLNSVEATAAAELRGRGAFLPSVNGYLSFGGSSNRVETGQDDFGAPVRLAEPLAFRGSSASQGLDASVAVFDGGRALGELRAARSLSRAAAARVDGESWRLRSEVSRRYYALKLADRLVELESRLLASAEEQLASTRELLRVAARNPEDVLGARVAHATQEQALDRARGERTKARLALLEAMGVGGDGDVAAADPLPPVFDPAALDGDALVAAASASSPRVRQQEAELAAAERRADAARAGRWPTLSLRAGVGRAMTLSSYEALGELNPQNRSYSFGMSASLPVFRQFQTHAAVAQADLARSDAALELRAARLAAEREARAALVDLGNAHRAAALAEVSARLAAEWLAMAQERYRLGALSFTELQNVIERAARAERERERALLDFAAARLALEERIGAEVRP